VAEVYIFVGRARVGAPCSGVGGLPSRSSNVRWIKFKYMSILRQGWYEKQKTVRNAGPWSIQIPIPFPSFHSLLERDTLQPRRLLDACAIRAFHRGLLICVEPPVFSYQNLANNYDAEGLSNSSTPINICTNLRQGTCWSLVHRARWPSIGGIQVPRQLSTCMNPFWMQN